MTRLEKILQRCEAATVELNRICIDRHGFRMSIPVQQTDSDIVIGNSLMDTAVVTKALQKAVEALDAIDHGRCNDPEECPGFIGCYRTTARSTLAEITAMLGEGK